MTTGAGSPKVALAAEIAALGLRGGLTPTEVGRATDALSHDADARVRAAALAALVRAAPTDAPGAWRVAVDDVDAAVRRRAAELAPELERAGEQPVGPLVALLADGDVTVVEAAAWALGELGDATVAGRGVTPLVATARTHRDPLAREAAVAALGALGDAEGLPAILDACSDRLSVRRRAVLALAPFEGPDVDAAITRALADRDWQVRQAAEDLGTNTRTAH